MDKYEKHKQLCDYMHNLYVKKNKDYGDSFHISFIEEGMAMPRIRLGDKFNRFKTLSRGNEANVKDESIRDTLIDLANYALMTVMEIDNTIENKNEFGNIIITSNSQLGKVREEVKNIMKFWLDMGVDGFREDVITYISKREGLPNAIPIPVAAGMEHYNCGPHLYEYLKEFHDDVLSKYDCFTVGEGPLITPEKVLRFVTEDDTQVLKTMFSFDHLEADCFMTDWIKTPFNLKKMKKCYQKWYDAMNGKGWHTLYLENHDHPRIVDRYGSLKYRVESAKMLATMCYLQKGTPFIY